MEVTEVSAVTNKSRPPSFWTSVREAVRGSHQDYTAISIDRAIFLLAVPMVLEMAMESLFTVVDVFWVAHLGSNAVATIGLTESVLTLVIAVAMGLGLSTTAMVARRTGEKDPEGAAVAAVQAIALGGDINYLTPGEGANADAVKQHLAWEPLLFRYQLHAGETEGRAGVGFIALFAEGM